jgi:hypothetical protein
VTALAELRDRGCEAAGYRLAGAPLEHVCARHLYGDDRMLTAWPAEDHAVVVAVGRHDQSSEDVYTLLLEALGLEVPDDEREKPPCCDDAGQPPTDPDVAADMANAIDRLRRARRRVR